MKRNRGGDHLAQRARDEGSPLRGSTHTLRKLRLLRPPLSQGEVSRWPPVQLARNGFERDILAVHDAIAVGEVVHGAGSGAGFGAR